MPRSFSFLAISVALALATMVAGCASTLDREFVPQQLVPTAEVDGLPGIRGWGDEPPNLRRLKAAEVPAIKARRLASTKPGEVFQSNILALSGGGENGAFGAGLLVGWGERGDRPEFDLVTGVSAGALIAPFAYLGTSYDAKLAELFTRIGSKDIFESTIVAGLLGGSAVASNDPLKGLIERYIDEEMMVRLAEQRATGRILLVGTTNLDAERPVFWDIGRIAQARSAHALSLIRSVLLASAAIPGVFPPVRIKVVANGRHYEELHVDGGPTRQVFFSPSDFSFRDVDKAIGGKVKRTLYVIRNGKLGPEWEKASEGLLSIGQRSLYATTKYQALGDLARIHSKAATDGIAFNLAAIPDSFKHALPTPFDHDYMKALYDTGYTLGRAGYSWMTAPPGLTATAGVQRP